MNPLKKFLTESKDIEKSAVIWNIVASMLVAFQSVITLVVIKRTINDGVTAGIYTFGNTLNNLFLSIGKYGMRFFQVSDVDREYNFREYRMSRIITTIAMSIISTIYVLIVANQNGYSDTKTYTIIWLCFFKLADSFEDVFYGDYQKNKRLDVASKVFALRLFITITLFAILIIVTRNFLVATIVSTIVTMLLLFVFLMMTREFVSDRTEYQMSRVWKLLAVTFPLCLGGVLTLYISAAPRTAIDRLMTEVDQEIYGYISMPVFVVQLLVLFIFNPLIYGLSCLWNENKISEYVKQCMKQFAFVFVVTIVCITGAWLLGIPVLSFIYNTDLAPYKTDLMIMMVGSGFLGLAGLLANLLTVMRYQNAILVGYALTSVCAFLFSGKAVESNGMRGAVNIYLILLIVLCVIFLAEFIYGVVRARGKNVQSTSLENE